MQKFVNKPFLITLLATWFCACLVGLLWHWTTNDVLCKIIFTSLLLIVVFLGVCSKMVLNTLAIQQKITKEEAEKLFYVWGIVYFFAVFTTVHVIVRYLIIIGLIA